MKKPDDSQVKSIGFRKAVPPEPTRYAQCRNCKFFAYDDEFYMSRRGGDASRKTNLRCKQHNVAVQMSTVCDSHKFAYTDRSDR